MTDTDRVAIKITKIILGVIAVAGVLSVALVAPGVFVAVKMFRKNNDSRFKDQIKQALKRMEQKPVDEMLEERYKKFRKMGGFTEK